MAREITPEEEAVIDAAKAWAHSAGVDAAKSTLIDLQAALHNLHASRQPKECRPPKGTIDGSWHWLINSDQMQHIVARWFSGQWQVWEYPINKLITPKLLAEHLRWRYFAPCLPPADPPSDEEIDNLAAAMLNWDDNDGKRMFRTFSEEHLREFACVIWARSTPKPVEWSDEEIEAAAEPFVNEHGEGTPWRVIHDFDFVAFARAILSGKKAS